MIHGIWMCTSRIQRSTQSAWLPVVCVRVMSLIILTCSNTMDTQIRSTDTCFYTLEPPDVTTIISNSTIARFPMVTRQPAWLLTHHRLMKQSPIPEINLKTSLQSSPRPTTKHGYSHNQHAPHASRRVAPTTRCASRPTP